MPAERLTMRKTKEVFRLKFDCHLSNRKIAESCLIARSTVAEYLFRFQQAALSWPLPEAMADPEKNSGLLLVTKCEHRICPGYAIDVSADGTPSKHNRCCSRN